jgi:hypothetical protein
MNANDYGIGYAHDEFAGTTATREQVEFLAAKARLGGDGPYKYRRPDGSFLPPCDYPASLDDSLRGDLRVCDTWDQARAVVEMKACQISQTGYKDRGKKATAEEREWAHMMFAAGRAKQQLERVPGTCRGCNSNPCRCIA